MAQAYYILERKLCLVHEQNAPKLRPLRFVDYVIICNNIALPSCFVLIAHQNEYLISLCHLMRFVDYQSPEKSKEQCCFGKKTKKCS